MTEHLPLVASADQGTALLRKAILDLAIRGLLVSQDDTDEPAGTLLERAAALKSSNPAKLASASEPVASAPYELPRGWVWTTLPALAVINPRNQADDDGEASFVPMAAIGTGFADGHSQETRRWGGIKSGFTHFAEGDIGVAKITPCFENSKACVFSGVINGIGAGTTELHVVRPLGGTLVPRYVLAYLKSPWFLDNGESKMTGTAGQKRLPKDFVERHPFPLPPLAEQHRIVAKVDELMALCDRLEARQQDAEAAHARLVQVLLDDLTRARDADVFRVCWQRLAERFTSIFSTEQSVLALERAIHTFALRGLLTESNGLPPSSSIEGPHPIPVAWTWQTLADVTSALTDGEHLTPQRTQDRSQIPLATAKNVRNGFIDLADTDFVTQEVAERCWLRCRPAAGDVLMVSVGATLGRLSVLREQRDMVIVRSVALFRPRGVDPDYLALALRSPLLQREIWSRVKQSAQPCLYLSQAKQLQIPVPPLGLQLDIVAKVTELLALCDQLKAHIAAARAKHAQLAEALVAQAVAA